MAMPSGFSQTIDLFKKVVRDKHTNAVKKTATAVHERVVNVTPIDTSRAMSNWIMSRNRPADGEVRYTPGSRGSSRGEALAITTENRNDILSKIRFGQDVWVANNVPYIIRLDKGWSPQYPGGFTLDAIEAARSTLKR